MAQPVPSIFGMSLADVQDYLYLWANNLQRNVGEAIFNMTPQKFIRIVVIVGAYLLLRPYITKLGSRLQTKEHEKEVDPVEVAAAAKISPNSLRGQVEVPDDSEEDEKEAEGQVTGADWGKKARRRQRQMVRRIVEADEKLRREQQEDEEDKDIEEFLVDT